MGATDPMAPAVAANSSAAHAAAAAGRETGHPSASRFGVVPRLGPRPDATRYSIAAMEEDHASAPAYSRNERSQAALQGGLRCHDRAALVLPGGGARSARTRSGCCGRSPAGARRAGPAVPSVRDLGWRHQRRGALFARERPAPRGSRRRRGLGGLPRRPGVPHRASRPRCARAQPPAGAGVGWLAAANAQRPARQFPPLRALLARSIDFADLRAALASGTPDSLAPDSGGGESVTFVELTSFEPLVTRRSPRSRGDARRRTTAERGKIPAAVHASRHSGRALRPTARCARPSHWRRPFTSVPILIPCDSACASPRKCRPRPASGRTWRRCLVLHARYAVHGGPAGRPQTHPGAMRAAGTAAAGARTLRHAPHIVPC